MSNYDAPIYMTYTVLAGSLIAGADLQDVSGPEGLTGKVVAISGLLTTGVTVAASSIVVGDGTTADLYATVPAPVQVVDTVVNQGLVKTTDANTIPANSRVVIGSGGGATAGAANIFVTIAWF